MHLKVMSKQIIDIQLQDNKIVVKQPNVISDIEIVEKKNKIEASIGGEYTDICITTPPIIQGAITEFEYKIAVAAEDLEAGDFVNIFTDNGITKCRKAIATSSDYIAHGYVVENVFIGNETKVLLEGINDKLSGLETGHIYFLSLTEAGKLVYNAPVPDSSNPSVVVQKLGVALSSNELSFERSQIIIRSI